MRLCGRLEDLSRSTARAFPPESQGFDRGKASPRVHTNVARSSSAAILGVVLLRGPRHLQDRSPPSSPPLRRTQQLIHPSNKQFSSSRGTPPFSFPGDSPTPRTLIPPGDLTLAKVRLWS